VNTPSVFNRRGGLSVTQAMSAGLGPGMHPRISIKGSSSAPTRTHRKFTMRVRTIPTAARRRPATATTVSRRQ